ncbi:MAG: hypothetical protein R8M37_03635 [Alphaproteobacteria bacterium]|nr:hypothetical protein [Alphaproteobacteria bacterium]
MKPKDKINMPISKYVALAAILVAIAPCGADALQYDIGKFSARLTGYGTFGMIDPDFESPLSIGDWRVRGQATYEITEMQKFGLVYALDKAATDKGNFTREAFGFWEIKNTGRVEAGYTDSIARKLGVGLPDVGALRINDRPIYNEKIAPGGPIIADTTLTSGRIEGVRLNVVSAPNAGAQYGVSVSGFSTDYDYTVDAGIKIRRPSGKVKTAYSFGASFMNRPHDFDNEVYTPGVTADWRAQATAGMNLQYNSWVWGLTTRVIYDQDPIGPVSDGIVAGTGVSYDLLKYSVSLTYMFSDTGIWNRDVADFQDHTAIASFRYKYSEYVDGWISGGLTSRTPFISAGLRATF